MLINVFFHLFLRPAVHGTFGLNPVLCHIVLDQLIRTETLLAGLAVHQWIRKPTQMAGSNPGLRIHQDRTVHPYIVGIFLYKLLPPRFFHIIFQLHAQIAVIPGVGKAAIDLTARIYKTAVFRQGFNFIHCFFHMILSSLFLITASLQQISK